MTGFSLNEHTKGYFTRRAFIGTGATALLASSVTLPRAARADQQVHYFTWGGYDNEGLHRLYIAKHGAPSVSFFGNLDEALSKVRAGYDVDVAHTCAGVSLTRWVNAGLLQPIDPARIAGWDSIHETFKSIPSVIAGDGKVWMVPVDFGFSSILYRSDEVTPDGESFGILLDKRYERRIALIDDTNEMVHIGASVAGAKDPWRMTEEEIARMRDIWAAMLRNAAVFWQDATDLEQGLASGQVLVAVAYNESFYRLSRQGLPVRYMWSPKEGIYGWACGLSILAQHQASDDLIYDFIDSMTGPASGKTLMEEFGYAHANTATYDLIGIDRLKQIGYPVDPRDFLSTAAVARGSTIEYRDRLTQLWEKTKAEAGM